MSRFQTLARSLTPERVFAALFLVPLTAASALLALTSLRLRVEHDAPLLHYAAWLMTEQGRVPYRDIFETSLPGTFLFHAMLGGFFGYGDVPLRVADVVLLLLLAFVSVRVMRRFGVFSAWAGAVTFPLFYLMSPARFGLQRDYLGLIPVVAAVSLLPRSGAPVRAVRLVAMGVLFGVAALFKPHLTVGLPVLWVACARLPGAEADGPGAGSYAKIGALLGAGVLAPAALAGLWLFVTGALPAFFDMLFGYLPLHNELSGSLEVVRGWDRVVYLWANFWGFGGYGTWVVAACFGGLVVFALHRPERDVRFQAGLVLALAGVYCLYPVIAGKFWPYHHLPFLYFAILAAALGLIRAPGEVSQGWRLARIAPMIAFAVALLATSKPLHGVPGQIWARMQPDFTAPAPKMGRVDEIAAWLDARLEPGDRVQPLDWSSGALHGMLVAEAPIATRFVYDYHFYHHVSDPVIQGLRRQFESELRASPPRFLIRITDESKPWLRGRGTTRRYLALDRFVAEGYREAYSGLGYQILERVPGPAPP